MTVLVDAPIWPWRGERWAHLVSDRSLDELHRFANGLGLRRVGFQGDHYDIDAATRLRAIDQGALAVDGRELVARLRRAGLRDRSRHRRGWDRLGGHDELPRREAPHQLPLLIETAFDPAGLASTTLIGAAELVGAALVDGPIYAHLRVVALARGPVGVLVVDDSHPAGLEDLRTLDPGPGVTMVVGGNAHRRTVELFLPAPPP
ncbi:MAG: DUF4031 domain-containing protein [Actinomycetia bacterium]|nr:DUF4031 domain-containing protein [Actinomycetes bacterium]